MCATGRLGAVQVAQWSNGPGRATRTAKHIDDRYEDLCKLVVHSAGRIAGEQHGRQTLFGRGDLTLIDLSQPFRYMHGTSRTICVAFPRTLTSLGRADVVRLSSARIRGDRGSGR